MISAGAYSRKYQAIEREKMREMKDREKTFGKERSLFLSIQTSQRQRAMEVKKRAMAEAEEERRRKALEDRRHSQQQATDRFRSTIGRMKFSKPTTAGKKLNFPVRSKVARCSYLHKNSVNNFRLEQEFQDKHPSDAGRLTTEINSHMVESSPKFSLQRKSPSLDDVSKGNEMQQLESPRTLSKSSDVSGFSEDNRKSCSDSDLNVIAQPKTLHSQPEPQSSGEGDSVKSNETAMFYPSVRSSPVPVSKHSHLEVTSVSPTPMWKIDDDFVEDDFGSSLDSLNSSVPAKPNEAIPALLPNHEVLPRNSEELANYTAGQESDASVTDSLESSSIHLNSSPSKSESLDGEKLNCAASKHPVGILKKNNRGTRIPKTNLYTRSRFNRPPQDFTGSTNLSQVSNGSSKSQKKVRFSDQVEVSVRNSSPLVMNISDPVQIELWKRVFPKDFSHRSTLPNSAFTPKLKCSLSCKAGMCKTYKKPLVHMPAAILESSPSPYNLSNSSGETLDYLDGFAKEDSTQEQAVLKPFDKTPTDAEINTMWDKIRQCLQDGRKVSVPPRLFNFNPPQENALSRPVTNTFANSTINSKPLSSTNTLSTTAQSATHKKSADYRTQKHLVYRHANQGRKKRSCSDSIHFHFGHGNTQYTTPEPVQIKSRVQYAVQPTRETFDETQFSLEEQRLMQSIEKINQRLQDHLHASDVPEFKKQYYYPVPPSTKPKKHSSLPVRLRGLGEATEGQNSTPQSRYLSYNESAHIN